MTFKEAFIHSLGATGLIAFGAFATALANGVELYLDALVVTLAGLFLAVLINKNK